MFFYGWGAVLQNHKKAFHGSEGGGDWLRNLDGPPFSAFDPRNWLHISRWFIKSTQLLDPWCLWAFAFFLFNILARKQPILLSILLRRSILWGFQPLKRPVSIWRDWWPNLQSFLGRNVSSSAQTSSLVGYTESWDLLWWQFCGVGGGSAW